MQIKNITPTTTTEKIPNPSVTKLMTVAILKTGTLQSVLGIKEDTGINHWGPVTDPCQLKLMMADRETVCKTFVRIFALIFLFVLMDVWWILSLWLSWWIWTIPVDIQGWTCLPRLICAKVPIEIPVCFGKYYSTIVSSRSRLSFVDTTRPSIIHHQPIAGHCWT